jgi:vancomycin resistance protein VanW
MSQATHDGHPTAAEPGAPARRRVTEVVPALIPLRMAQRRATKRVRDALSRYDYADTRRDDDLPVLVHEYASVLQRSLEGVDPQLQRNKVGNLRLASGRIDGVVLRPGQTFSFWRLVGSATERRGYRPGLVLRNGEASSGIGGGLCQISNMLHWLALHSDLAVTERHHHSYDPFPDADRVVPFGTGATLLEWIYDLKLSNPTRIDYQLRLRLTDTHLVGQLRASAEPPARYEVLERDHRFTRSGPDVYRSNRIVRRPIGAHETDEIALFANRSRVGYPVAEDRID